MCADLSGTVLELGFGSGRNVPYLPAAVDEVLAVEPADLAWERAGARIAAYGRPVTRIGLDGAFTIHDRGDSGDLMGLVRHDIGLPATRWMLELGAIFMRTETELVLKSRRVVPGRLLEQGFVFDFPRWPEAAKDLVERWRAGRG